MPTRGLHPAQVDLPLDPPASSIYVLGETLLTLTIRSMLTDGGQVPCELTESLTVQGDERTFFIAGFYQLRGGLIASAKIYREGSAEIAR